MKYKVVGMLYGQFVGESQLFDTKEEAQEELNWLIDPDDEIVYFIDVVE